MWAFINISKNETLMDLAIRYTTKIVEIRKINICRLFKQAIYLLELLTSTGKTLTSTYTRNDSLSQLKWEFFYDTYYPSRASWNIWKQFICWLCLQRITSVQKIDFKSYAEWWIHLESDTLFKRNGNNYTDQY